MSGGVLFQTSPFLAILLLQALTSVCLSVKLEYHTEYYSNVTLACDERLARQAYPAFLKYWILPNQTTIQWSQQPDGKHRLSARPEYSLTINHVEDDDLGSYHCVILWDNRYFIVDSIKIDLSVSYSDISDRYKKQATIGGAVAAATGFVLILVSLLCYLMNSASDDANMRKEEERQVVYELDRTVQRFDETLAEDAEMVRRNSEIPVISSSVRQTTDADYATVNKVGKVVAIETMSEGSSGFFDNKVFEIENETMFPYDESNSDMNLDFSHELGDMRF